MEDNIKEILRLVKEVGWDIALPQGGGEEDDGELKGMIIGELSYVNYILKHLE
jgi:hypothetical protein